MMGLNGFGEAVVWLAVKALVFLVLFISLCISIHKVTSQKAGRKELAIAIGKKAAKRMTFFLILVQIGIYTNEVHLRNHVIGCEINEPHKSDGILYFAEICYAVSPVTSYGRRLRIYSAVDKSLLAERTYLSVGEFHLQWTSDSVWYDNGVWFADRDNYINLPPTWYDRLLLKLP